MSKRRHFTWGRKGTVRTDDGVARSWSGAFGDCQSDVSIGELETLSERVG